MIISLVVAASDDDVIAKDGKTPWFVRGEQLIFRRLTMGRPVIMGRKTYETSKNYKSKPMLLPHRLNIIITRKQDYGIPEEGIIAQSLEEALAIPEVET